MIETRRLKNDVIFFQTIPISFVYISVGQKPLNAFMRFLEKKPVTTSTQMQQTFA